MSPNYPSNYKPNLYCEWLIETELTHSLQLHFVDLVMEKIDSDEGCVYDSVQVNDHGFK